MEWLDHATSLPTDIYVWKRREEVCDVDGNLAAYTNKEYVIADKTLLGKLKAHAIFSFRQDLKQMGEEDLADFILHAPQSGGNTNGS